jgi:hypothetical protein
MVELGLSVALASLGLVNSEVADNHADVEVFVLWRLNGVC